MQVNANRLLSSMWLPIALIVNTMLAFGYYVGWSNINHSQMLKSNFTNMSEIAFCFGILMLLISLLVIRKLENSHRWMLLCSLTLFNQACLICFLISII